ncbi:uncharacterized protein LOC110451526 [Mizuhopecten yessoensis]|uniref:uncharacterized protein LOC110451526 n=1 Tax=Mizuhopecten yessoensis TaxID=6573 RepID=UPI000B45D495|nr:uncharacterized protein LOC110451526 [Mizuhopecten yessoensis]
MARAMGNLVNAEINDRTREDSFRVWHHPNIPIGSLVTGGFSCINSETSTVACTACGLEVDASNLNGTNLSVYHVQRSPECLFFYPDHPYRKLSDRIQTYLYWLGYRGAPDIDDLATAGFYVTEFGQEEVRCFCCDLLCPLTLRQIDDIRKEHALLSPNCAFSNNS